jgi:hypothetical protein
MRRILLILLLFVASAAAGYFVLRGFALFGPLPAGVRPVPQGWQEIAYLSPATSTDSWERFVAAVRFLQGQWPEEHPELPPLGADLEHVFPERTTDVPELSLWLGQDSRRLVVRWYKTSSEVDPASWIKQLAGRGRPPLAILGGENSERALSTARLLCDYRGQWDGPDPLFFITTATADRFPREDAGSAEPLTAPQMPKLMDVYKGRSFRFAFTNSRMAAVVMAFVKDHPEVWSNSPHLAASSAGVVSAGDGLTALTLLTCRDHMSPISFYALAWADDPYSLDLSDRFGEVFKEQFADFGSSVAQEAERMRIRDEVPYSVGDRDRPNPPEAAALDRFFDHNPLFQGSREILVLPTGTDRARRVLHTLANQAPLDLGNLIVVSGDSIPFNSVYRDRDVAWNVQNMPVPLIFFSHRNPINRAAGFHPKARPADPSAPTGTQDLLLYRDVLSALLQAACLRSGEIGDADQVISRLRGLRWLKGHLRTGGEGRPFFNADGDRSAGTGEHVVWVHPVREGGRVMARATISVWRLGPDHAGQFRWHLAGEPLQVTYDWPTPGSGQ